VFVHGLGGDRVGTWTSEPTKKIPVKCFWPKDLLPKDCPSARILSFGYNSEFVNFFPWFGGKAVSQQTAINDYSAGLYQALTGFRESTKTPSNRPIIYVAHSLGGLVVANALWQNDNAGKEEQALTDNVVGIIFLGTPFAGSQKATWGDIGLKIVKALGTTKDTDVKDLKERSARLVTINEEFDKFTQRRDRKEKNKALPPVRVVCYFEEQPTYFASKDVGFVVDKESATRVRYDKVLSIDEDHVNMTKFPNEYSNDYKSVAAQLKSWVDNLGKGDEDQPEKVGSPHQLRYSAKLSANHSNTARFKSKKYATMRV
jgi:protein SERAC1